MTVEEAYEPLGLLTYMSHWPRKGGTQDKPLSPAAAGYKERVGKIKSRPKGL